MEKTQTKKEDIKVRFFDLSASGKEKIQTLKEKRDLGKHEEKLLAIKTKFIFSENGIEKESECLLKNENQGLSGSPIWTAKLSSLEFKPDPNSSIKVKLNLTYEKTESENKLTKTFEETIKLTEKEIERGQKIPISDICLFTVNRSLIINFLNIDAENFKAKEPLYEQGINENSNLSEPLNTEKFTNNIIVNFEKLKNLSFNLKDQFENFKKSEKKYRIQMAARKFCQRNWEKVRNLINLFNNFDTTDFILINQLNFHNSCNSDDMSLIAYQLSVLWNTLKSVFLENVYPSYSYLLIICNIIDEDGVLPLEKIDSLDQLTKTLLNETLLKYHEIEDETSRTIDVDKLLDSISHTNSLHFVENLNFYNTVYSTNICDMYNEILELIKSDCSESEKERKERRKKECIIELKFLLMQMNNNLKFNYQNKPIFNNDEEFVIDEFKFISFQETEINKKDFSETDFILIENVKKAYVKFSQILKQLKKGDDLYNYLKFISNPVHEDLDKSSCFLFESSQSEDFLEITNNNPFIGFILYSTKERERQLRNDQNRNSLTEEFCFSFLSNEFVPGVVCLNRNLIIGDLLENEDFYISHFIFYILHEFSHKITYKNKPNNNFHKINSPNFKQKIGNQKEDIGKLLEHLIADDNIEKFFVKHYDQRKDELYKVLTDPSQWKSDMKNILNSLLEINDQFTVSNFSTNLNADDNTQPGLDKNTIANEEAQKIEDEIAEESKEIRENNSCRQNNQFNNLNNNMQNSFERQISQPGLDKNIIANEEAQIIEDEIAEESKEIIENNNCRQNNQFNNFNNHLQDSFEILFHQPIKRANKSECINIPNESKRKPPNVNNNRLVPTYSLSHVYQEILPQSNNGNKSLKTSNNSDLEKSKNKNLIILSGEIKDTMYKSSASLMNSKMENIFTSQISEINYYSHQLDDSNRARISFADTNFSINAISNRISNQSQPNLTNTRNHSIVLNNSIRMNSRRRLLLEGINIINSNESLSNIQINRASENIENVISNLNNQINAPNTNINQMEVLNCSNIPDHNESFAIEYNNVSQEVKARKKFFSSKSLSTIKRNPQNESEFMSKFNHRDSDPKEGLNIFNQLADNSNDQERSVKSLESSNIEPINNSKEETPQSQNLRNSSSSDSSKEPDKRSKIQEDPVFKKNSTVFKEKIIEQVDMNLQNFKLKHSFLSETQVINFYFEMKNKHNIDLRTYLPSNMLDYVVSIFSMCNFNSSLYYNKEELKKLSKMLDSELLKNQVGLDFNCPKIIDNLRNGLRSIFKLLKNNCKY